LIIRKSAIRLIAVAKISSFFMINLLGGLSRFAYPHNEVYNIDFKFSAGNRKIT
jgi:hypothetical protein